MEKVIEVKNISKTYKHQHAVEHVSMSIYRGDIYGLIGRNGAGKTTLIKLITKLIQETNGTISLFGSTNNKEYLEGLSRVGSIIETPTAYPNLSARENLEYYRVLFGVNDKNDVDSILKKVNLDHTGKKKFKEFSLGMKQRLGLAIALLNKPDLLILDEPINGLDPIAIIELRELIAKLNKEEHITVLISSHILNELYHVSTRFGFINEGKLIKEISKKEFDEDCKASIQFKVDDVDKATFHLQKYASDMSFKVTGTNEIHVYNHLDEAGDLNILLVKEGVKVLSFKEMQSDIEMYFKELIEGGQSHA